MVDKVNVSPGHTGRTLENADTFKYGGHSNGWVLSSDESILGDHYSLDISGRFERSHSGLDVTVSDGEAIVGGVPIARDVSTTVTLNESTNNQVVYVGWSHTQKDTVIIGLESEFVADDRKIPLGRYDTDSSSVISAEDITARGERVSVKNVRYEGSDGPEAKVDHAKLADNATSADHADVADSLSSGTIDESTLLHSNQNDTADGIIGFGADGTIAGTLGASDGELWRAATANGDTDFIANAYYNGQFQFAQNAEYDKPNDVWKRQAQGSAALIGFKYFDGAGNYGGLQFCTAPNDAAGSTIDWNIIQMHENGSFEMYENETRGFVVENVDSLPFQPAPGRLVYME